MQILMIVSAFVRKYDFSAATDVPVGVKPMMMLRPAGAVTMNFRAVS
jgi:hypothetical protein